MNVVTRGIRNAFRNQIRTFSIVIILGLSIGLSLAMLVARQAVTQKISSVKSSVGNTVSVSPAGVRGFEGGGNALTTADVTTLSKLAHVSSVSSSLNDRLSSSDTNLQSAVDAGNLGRRFARQNGFGEGAGGFGGNGGGSFGDKGTGSGTFTPPVTVIGTTSPTDLSSGFGGGSFTLVSGKVFDGSSSENVAVIGKNLADKNNLHVGSTFQAYGQNVSVVGIYDSGNTFSNNQVIMPLKTVQTLSQQPDSVTAVTLNVDSVENVSTVTTAASGVMGSKADVTNASERAQAAIQPLQNIQTISLYSLIGAVATGAAIILLTMIMIVRERKREIGVLKAIGASNIKVMGQFASEAFTFTVLGAVLGILFGVAAGNPITKLLVTSSASSARPGGGFGRRAFGGVARSVSNVHAVIGWEMLLYGLGIAVLIAILGSVLASFFIAKVRPAEVMRTE